MLNVRQTTSGISDFALHSGFFSCVICFFGQLVFESNYVRLLLEQHFRFRDLVIRADGLLQIPSQLNETSTSLLEMILQRSTIPLYTTIISLYDSYTSSVKWSNPGHFLKSQGKSFLSLPFFYIFLTSKITNETLKSFLGCPILHYYDKVRRFYFLDTFSFCIFQII